MIGYVLIILGLFLLLISGYGLYVSAYPPLVEIGDNRAILSGPMFLMYLLSSIILLYPGSYLIRRIHKRIRATLGLIILLLAIIFPAIIYLLEPDTLLVLPLMTLFPLSSSLILITGEPKYGNIVLMLALLYGSGALLNA